MGNMPTFKVNNEESFEFTIFFCSFYTLAPVHLVVPLTACGYIVRQAAQVSHCSKRVKSVYISKQQVMFQEETQSISVVLHF